MLDLTQMRQNYTLAMQFEKMKTKFTSSIIQDHKYIHQYCSVGLHKII
jgi:hypothetical protein